MASLQNLKDDFTSFRSDLSAKLAEVQSTLDQLRSGALTAEQQAIVDSVDAGIAEADASIKAFDAPPAPGPTPEQP